MLPLVVEVVVRRQAGVVSEGSAEMRRRQARRRAQVLDGQASVALLVDERDGRSQVSPGPG